MPADKFWHVFFVDCFPFVGDLCVSSCRLNSRRTDYYSIGVRMRLLCAKVRKANKDDGKKKRTVRVAREMDIAAAQDSLEIAVPKDKGIECVHAFVFCAVLACAAPSRPVHFGAPAPATALELGSPLSCLVYSLRFSCARFVAAMQ